MLVQKLLDIDGSLLSFFVYLHFASLLAILTFLYKRLLRLSRADVLHMAIATVPIVILTLLIKDYLDIIFASERLVVVALLITAAINIYNHRQSQKDHQGKITLRNSWNIGLGQAFAILPGVSRSGTTLAACQSQKVEKNESLNFTFLLAIPAIIGANVFDFLQGGQLGQEGVSLPQLLLAMVVTYLSTLLSLKLLQQLLKKKRLLWFALYCLVISAISSFWLW
jgi:undecaprenyl-diphosphatase